VVRTNTKRRRRATKARREEVKPEAKFLLMIASFLGKKKHNKKNSLWITRLSLAPVVVESIVLCGCKYYSVTPAVAATRV
jgi:hypothetical protein